MLGLESATFSNRIVRPGVLTKQKPNVSEVPGQLSPTGDSHAEQPSPAGLQQPRSPAMTDGGPQLLSPSTKPQLEIPLQVPTPAQEWNVACPGLGTTFSEKWDPKTGCGDTDLESPRSRAGEEQQEKDERALRARPHLAPHSLAGGEGRSLFPGRH